MNPLNPKPKAFKPYLEPLEPLNPQPETLNGSFHFLFPFSLYKTL